MNVQVLVIALGCALATAPRALAAQELRITDPAVRAFVEQADRELPATSAQHGVIVRSLNLLANAIVSLAQRGDAQVRIADDIARLRVDIRGYQSGGADAATQSGRLRRTLIQASGLMQRLVVETSHVRRASDPELNALRRAAESVDETQSLVRQPDVLERFFEHAATILQGLDRRQAQPSEV